MLASNQALILKHSIGLQVYVQQTRTVTLYVILLAYRKVDPVLF